MGMHILLIENNNLAQTESLLTQLQSHDCQVILAHTPDLAANRAQTVWPNLIIFNPVNSRSRLTSYQKALNKIELKVPFMVVSNESELAAVAHTDTIFVTPNDPQQLIQAIKKAIHRQEDRFIRLPDLIIDSREYRLLRHNQCHHLTPKEYKLLQLLIDHRDHDLSRRAIMKEVWETDYMGDTRTLDVHIRWLREKIEESPSHPRRLLTIRGIGYRFITNPE